MRKSLFVSYLLFFSTLPLCSLAQWQADMTNNFSGEKQYKVYSDLTQYRYEFIEDGMAGVVITNPSTNITAIMLVDEKKVHYTESNGMMSAMNDPVMGYKSSTQYLEEKILGEEEISGYKCVKKALMQGEEEFYIQWFSPELNFPLRMIGTWGEKPSMQLENIQDWDVDPSKFIVPEDYIEVDEELRPVIPEPDPPEEWSVEDVSAPVDMALSRGMAVNVSILETVYHKFIIENTGDTPAKFIYHMYKDGIELPDNVQGPEERRTERLYMDEDYRMTHDWEAGQVIFIKVYEGNVNLKIYKE